MLNRLNKYQIMWLFVHFDLPTETKENKKEYTKFRKYLLDDGFKMLQYSMYARHCSSRENADVHKKRIKKKLPALGQVIVFEITDVQFGRIEFFNSQKLKPPSNLPKQLELF